MTELKVTKGKYPQIFGGAGFHNNDATMYHVIEKEHFNQVGAKCYREISPGFMRTFSGFSDWSKEAMDEFAEYYESMQKWTDTPMYLTPATAKLHFTDEEMRQYCEDVADRLSYLYFEKNVKHIRYYCFSNELSQVMHGVLLDDLETFKKYHQMLYSAFQKRNLPIGLLATDATEYENWNTIDWAIENMAAISEDYCVHIYEREHGIYDETFYDFFYEKCLEIVKKSILNFGKRLILGEIGIQKNAGQLTFGNGVVIDTCRYFENEKEQAGCALMLTEMAFAAINAGVFAFNYWSYIDHPDPYSCAYSTGDDYSRKWGESERFISSTTDSKYNKWGFLKWDDEGDYGARLHYWCIAPLVKLFKRNSKVLDISCDDKKLRSCAILNRDGSVSMGIVNRHSCEQEITIKSDLFNKNIRVYEYDPENVPYNRFADLQDYSMVIDKDTAVYKLKAQSVTFFTTDYTEKEQSVFANNLSINDKILSWDATDDVNHCYYRVFASDKKDFKPSEENQIASTIAESIPIDDDKLYYKVLSVDKSGNI